MQTIALEEFLDSWSRDLAARRRADECERTQLTEDSERMARSAMQLASDLTKKTALHTQMAAEGLATSDIDAQINHFSQVLETTKTEEAQVRARLKARDPLLELTRPHIDDLREQLIELDCHEAVVFPNLVNFYRWLPLSFADHDPSGSPKLVRVHLGRQSDLEVPIITGDRVLRDYRPRDLDWLPRTSSRARVDEDVFLAVHIESSRQRLLTSNTFEASHPDSEIQYSERFLRTYEVDCSHLALTILEHLQQALQPVSLPLRIDGDYEPGSLADVIRDRVMEATTTEPEFRPSRLRPTSAEVERTISAHWATFVQSPWHAGVTGQLALLKYLTERGEQPRFWAGPFENHYGFRLRTRDHDWLVGDLYVEGPSAASSTGIEVHERGEWGYSIASVGSLKLRVKREK